ncbi:hypothetical protein ACFW2V_13485 [Streptomyces sp. NPDC058947]|uniref:hypothetical protein n=1 Tax=Streptomyces sp. NPDC058947 TaxID=3346675 RepID=UPI0036B97D91
MRPDYEDMRDWAYREANPGYEREIGLTASDLEDCDPELARAVAEKCAHDNGKRRENNLRTENAQLRALLEENGIEIPGEG